MTGFGSNGNEEPRKTEVFCLNDPITTCQDLALFPVGMAGAFRGLLGQVPIVCGGWAYSTSTYLRECRVLKAGLWSLAGELNQARSAAASVRLNDHQLLVTGGRGRRGLLSSSEIITMASGSQMALTCLNQILATAFCI